MMKEINLTFHRQGLRSFIEVDLCAECPRQDNKGCCGFYSPVFYTTDLYFIKKQQPELIEYIANLPRLTILDASITVNSLPDDEGFRCQFHSIQKGCLLPMELRESVCRHFVCPGIAWWKEDTLIHWKEYFDLLADYEIQINSFLALSLDQKGLSLRNLEDWGKIFGHLEIMMTEISNQKEEPGGGMPRQESARIMRSICFGSEWPL